MSLIDSIYDTERKRQNEIVLDVINLDLSEADFVVEDERAYPGQRDFLKSGYYNKMLKRYLFSGKYFCSGKKVIDSCCGLGWGTYLISNYASHVYAFDFDVNVIEFCQKKWQLDNVTWQKNDALSLNMENFELFDVALAMETIEHFTAIDGEQYIKNLINTLVHGGKIVGTSAFPRKRTLADEICSKNKYHLHIFTEDEMLNILKKYCTKYNIIDNWMFIGEK